MFAVPRRPHRQNTADARPQSTSRLELMKAHGEFLTKLKQTREQDGSLLDH
jgi:hypothetical protein